MTKNRICDANLTNFVELDQDDHLGHPGLMPEKQELDQLDQLFHVAHRDHQIRILRRRWFDVRWRDRFGSLFTLPKFVAVNPNGKIVYRVAL